MNERDDFWDISKLVPKKKKPVSPFVTKQQIKEVNISGDASNNSEDRSIGISVPSALPDRNSFEYQGGATLIKRVSIVKFVDKYDFYGSFRKAALLYYDVRGKKCEFAPFFSYMPQYSQLNQAQKNYYFYWRDEVRRGNYLKSDYPYIYLYIYEILNLPDKIEPNRGIELLVDLWKAYGKEFPNLNSQLSLWIQDYCLMYDLACPIAKLEDMIGDVIRSTDFIEFYISDLNHISFEFTEALLSHLSYYDWRRGKYAGGESRRVYKKHLLGAMHLLLSNLIYDGKLFSSGEGLSKISRPSFSGSLCTHSVKARLEIEYQSIKTIEAVREAITEALRYTENRLRALLSVKSRLAVKNIPNEYKNIIDSYFDDAFSKIQQKRKQEAKPEYEKLYDGEREELSFINADEIERLSWTSTERLVEDIDDEEFEDTAPPHKEEAKTLSEVPNNAPKADRADGITDNHILYLKALLSCDSGLKKQAISSSGELEEGLIDKINELFSDEIGDIVIETSGENSEIIEDYREDVIEWIERTVK